MAIDESQTGMGDPMNIEDFITAMADILAANAVPNAPAEARQFVLDNPGIEQEMTASAAAEDWIAVALDAADWRDPAAHG